MDTPIGASGTPIIIYFIAYFTLLCDTSTPVLIYRILGFVGNGIMVKTFEPLWPILSPLIISERSDAATLHINVLGWYQLYLNQ